MSGSPTSGPSHAPVEVSLEEALEIGIHKLGMSHLRDLDVDRLDKAQINELRIALIRDTQNVLNGKKYKEAAASAPESVQMDAKVPQTIAALQQEPRTRIEGTHVYDHLM